jgi:hypothetical protein
MVVVWAVAAPAMAQEIDSPTSGGTRVLADEDPCVDNPSNDTTRGGNTGSTNPQSGNTGDDECGQVVAAGSHVLAATGYSLTVGAVLLAAVLLTLGFGTLLLARRRATAAR